MLPTPAASIFVLFFRSQGLAAFVPILFVEEMSDWFETVNWIKCFSAAF